jgi:hypothetical protein
MIMKRKSLILSSLLLAIAASSFGQVTNQLANFPTKQWTATVKVVGENEQPVGGANVVVSYVLPPYSFSDDTNYNANISGVTDTNGIFFAAHNDRTGKVGFSVNKQEYYETRSSRTLRDPEENANDRDISLTLILEKVEKPIAMYAKSIVHIKFPELGKPIGYDLMIGDWVGPYGKGVNSDIFFEREYFDKGPNNYFGRITITFPKKNDGIQIFTQPEAEIGSIFRSPHEAPIEGYQHELTRETSALPGQASKVENDPNRIYLFRVRTVTDDGGNIVSAHYGKIYGDFTQFSYYLNPTPSDRNIEFDPKQNLLGGEQISAP